MVESLLSLWAKILSTMADRNRLLILVALFDKFLTSSKSHLSFSELRKITNLPKNTLSYHLNVLLEAGLILKPGSYLITEEGREILSTLGVSEEFLQAYRAR